MDSISVDTPAENDWVTSVLRKNDISYIWTGGRKCNFRGCDRPDLQPAIENGWYWAPTGKRIPPPGQKSIDIKFFIAVVIYMPNLGK